MAPGSRNMFLILYRYELTTAPHLECGMNVDAWLMPTGKTPRSVEMVRMIMVITLPHNLDWQSP